MLTDIGQLLQQPAIVGALVAASVSLLLAIPTVWISLNIWRQNRLTYFSNREARAEDLYDRLMDYRWKHPEVFRLSRTWQPECLSKIYTQANDDKIAVGDQKASMWAFAYSYDLSKRTSVALTYAQIKNNSGASYNLFTSTSLGLGGSAGGMQAGEDPKMWGVTMRHAF